MYDYTEQWIEQRIRLSNELFALSLGLNAQQHEDKKELISPKETFKEIKNENH